MTTRLSVAAKRVWNAVSKQSPAPLAAPDTYSVAAVARMLREIGIALLEGQVPSGVVETRLMHVAERYTSEPVLIVALPTVLIIQVGSNTHEVAASTRGTTQLDRLGRIDFITRLAEAGAIAPDDAVGDITEARTAKPRFGPVTILIGYVITTLGFGMVINPAWSALWAYVFLGAVVGLIVVATRPLPTLTAIVPSLSAAVVTVLATWFVADAAGDDLLRIIAPALVATLPGLALTIGAMELAGGAAVAGSSRLVYGVVQLMLLVFGVAIGLAIAGPVTPHEPDARMGPLSFYVAIVVIAVGLYMYLSAPRGSLIWLIAAMTVALIGQRVGGFFLSTEYTGAVGALLVFPFAVVAAKMKTAPPMFVMLRAAFWSLVPGALGFESIGEAATQRSLDAGTLVSTFAAIFSIALGTLVAWSFYDIAYSRAARGIRSGPASG
ncbi:MAG: threonine/serine exporter ThrE family protein [Mycolicibacterium sp.]|uniref:threonine/serine ThrE exporter family protein n=1 Tax=Mycolicibacterium sp. TaxID=2320850 RepID=UPI003D0C0E04